MPDPRPLGNVARSVLHSVCGALEQSQDAIFDVEVAAQNNLALRVITFMLADRQKDAEEVLMQAKLRKSARSEPTPAPAREKQP